MDRRRALMRTGGARGTRLHVLLALANLGLWMALFAPLQVLLAQQVERIAPQDKEAALGLVTATGALLALLANAAAGAASDRTISRWGPRHPWTLGGAVTGALALLWLGGQQTLLGVALAWCLAQAALNAMLAALSAEVPDRVPVAERARCSAWAGAAQPLGVVLGTALVTEVADGIGAGYAWLALLLLVCSAVYVVASGPGPQVPPRSAIAPAAPAWRDADFRWAWITRMLLNLGNALATLYLLYFLRDEVGYERRFPGEQAEDGLLKLIVLYTAGVLVAAFAAGAASDRWRRRKPLVTLSGLVLAVASALLAGWPQWPMVQGAALLMGLGFGIYLAVDQALVTEVLPAADRRGADLGLINIASAGPQVFGPALAALLVTQAGYGALYAASALVTLAGALLVGRIRRVA